MLMVIVKVVKKDVCYMYDEKKRLAQVSTWVKKEKVGMFLGVLYVVGTSWYVAVFLFMLPPYATASYLQATGAAVFVIEVRWHCLTPSSPKNGIQDFLRRTG